MDDKNPLRQQIWELIYGLLTDAEADLLRERISSDPDVARVYVEESLRLEQVAKVARCEDVALTLRRPSELSPASKPAAAHRPSRRRTLARRISWGIAAAAAVLLCATAGSLLQIRALWDGTLAQRQAEALFQGFGRVVLVAPAQWHPAADQRVSLATTSLSGERRSQTLSLEIRDRQQQTLWHQEVVTDSSGRADVKVPSAMVGEAVDLLVRSTDESSPALRAEIAAADPQYVTRAATDRAVYRGGETVYYRSLTLDRFGMRAAPSIDVAYQIVDPNQQVIEQFNAAMLTVNGVGDCAFTLDDDAVGGTYALVARSPNGQFDPARAEFCVLPARPAAMDHQIEFLQDTYRAGETVVADLALKRSAGGPAAKANVRFQAEVDGQVFWHDDIAQLQADGTHQVRFTLPDSIKTPTGSLSMIVDDDGALTELTQPIPIDNGRLQVTFYPEGGDLVAGLESRVYVEATDSRGAAVTIGGRVIDSGGQPVAAVHTQHHGRGVFSFTPRSDQSYQLELDSPGSFSGGPFAVPPCVEGAFVALSVPSGVLAADQPLRFRLQSTRPDVPLVVAATCRGVMVGQQLVTPARTGQDLTLPLADDVQGVLRLTVYDGPDVPLTPLAERLVYRRGDRHLNVALSQQREVYSPGSSVELELAVTDESGHPTPATLSVGVLNRSLAGLTGVRSPSIDTYFYLASDFDSPLGLEDADFGLSDDPRADEALDLLLGTVGWRRFVVPSSGLVAAVDPNRGDGAPVEALLEDSNGDLSQPQVLDNGVQAHQQYASVVQALNDSRASMMRMLGGLLFAGGTLLLAALIVQRLWRLSASWRLWLPSLAAAGLCLLLGTSWLAQRPAAVGIAASDLTLLANNDGRQKRYLLESRRQPIGQSGLARAAQAQADQALVAWGLGSPVDRSDEWFSEADTETRTSDHFASLARYGDTAAYFIRIPRETESVLQSESNTIRANELSRGVQPPDQPSTIVASVERPIRAYAFKRPDDSSLLGVARERSPDSLYWHPRLITDEHGRASVQFDLAANLASYVVSAEAHGQGRLGHFQGGLEARLPYQVESNLPLAVSEGDRFDVPLQVTSVSDEPIQVQVDLMTSEHLRVVDPSPLRLDLQPGQRWSDTVPVKVLNQTGQASVAFRFREQAYTHSIVQRMQVSPAGYPASRSFAGVLQGQLPVRFDIPADAVANSVQFSVRAFPSPIADLQQGAWSMASDSVGSPEVDLRAMYPDLLAFSYTRQQDMANPVVTRRAKRSWRELQNKLQVAQTVNRYYEQDFGQSPPVEMMETAQIDLWKRTAIDMAATRFSVKHRGRDANANQLGINTVTELQRVLIAKGLSDTADDESAISLEKLFQSARQTRDGYLTALAALALSDNSQQEQQVSMLLQALAQQQHRDGHLSPGGKKDLPAPSAVDDEEFAQQVAATSLATLAWLKRPAYYGSASKAVQWLLENRQSSGGFGSPDATVLALKAIVEHAKLNLRPVRQGELIVRSDGVDIARGTIHADQKEMIGLTGPLDAPSAGHTELTLELTSGNAMPYVMDVTYRVPRVEVDQRCRLTLATRLSDRSVQVGRLVSLTVEIENHSGEPLPAVVSLGLPGGLSPRAEQLDELVRAKCFDQFETRPGEVLLYWQSIGADARQDNKLRFDLDLIGEIPGQFTGSASQAYSSATPQHQSWSAPLSIEVRR